MGILLLRYLGCLCSHRVLDCQKVGNVWIIFLLAGCGSLWSWISRPMFWFWLWEGQEPSSLLSVLYRTSLALYSICHMIYSYLCSLLVMLSIVFLFDLLSSEFKHLYFFSTLLFMLNYLSMLWHLPVMLTFPPILMTSHSGP